MGKMIGGKQVPGTTGTDTTGGHQLPRPPVLYLLSQKPWSKLHFWVDVSGCKQNERNYSDSMKFIQSG